MTNAAAAPPPGSGRPPAGYLDHGSATPLRPEAHQALLAALEHGFADPRRLHGPGRRARLLLDNARAVVAECLDVAPDEVVFTHGGDDAAHRGLLGLLDRPGGRRSQAVHGAVEHASVLQALAWHGADHPQVPVDAVGRVDVTAMARAARAPDVGAVVLQAANHEIGTLQPVDDLDLPAGLPLVVDARAALGRTPLPRHWSVLTASAAEWGGPPGVGVLVVRRGTRWQPPFPGEPGLLDAAPAGDVPLVLAAAAALQAALAEQDELAARHRPWVDRIRAAAAGVPETEVVGDPVARLPHLVTFSCLYVGGEEIVHALDQRDLAVASGSACTSSTLEPSHVLAAIGALTHGNVRVSLGPHTTADDVDRLCAALPEVVAGLRG